MTGLSLLRVSTFQNLLRTRAGERLAGLDLDDFAFIANALTLIRLGLANLADVSREIANRLAVGTGDDDLVGHIACAREDLNRKVRRDHRRQ